jgi:hypothetical protein
LIAAFSDAASLSFSPSSPLCHASDHFLERAASCVNAAWEFFHTDTVLKGEALFSLLYEAQAAVQALISANLHLEVRIRNKS